MIATTKTASKAAKKPAAKPATKPTKKPAVKSTAKSAGKSTEKSTAKATKAVVKSAPKSTPKPAAPKPAAKPIAKPVSKPAVTNAKSGPVGFQPYKLKKGEEFMSEEQKAHFIEILQQWRRDLMEEVDRTMHHMQDEAANFPDPNDRASQEEEFNLELRARDRERKLLKKIQEALERIENDEYGYCEACGVEIDIRRLEARPTATQCIDCKTIDEFKEKQTSL